MKVDIDPDDLVTKGTDGRGRLTLGSEYADRDSITVAVVHDDGPETADAQPDPGWWSCEACGGDVRPADAHTKDVPGHDGPETLAFCERCWDE